MTKRSQIRKDYILNKHVIITPRRAARPKDFKEQNAAETTDNKNCPFCPPNIDKRLIRDKIKSSGSKSWDIMSIKNKYPAVSRKNKKAYGTQEVVIETPRHIKSLSSLSLEQTRKLLYMYKKRTVEIAKNKNIEYILCFKNEGFKAGTSLTHSHSQIFATKIIPENLKKEIQIIQKHKLEKGVCPYCDIIKNEIKSKRRVFEDSYTASFTPYASEFHYEIWLFPKRHVDNITLLKDIELKSLARGLKFILSKIKKLNLSFNFFLHNVVPSKDQHFYIKIQPRDSIWAGLELGSGLVINSVSPEQAAKFYRSKE